MFPKWHERTWLWNLIKIGIFDEIKIYGYLEDHFSCVLCCISLNRRWEGFADVALHCWYQIQKQLHRASVEPLSGILDLMPVTLLHVMIELFGASDSTLWEASLVGAHFCLWKPIIGVIWTRKPHSTILLIKLIRHRGSWKYSVVWK
jgi:hypothetical protein